MDGKFMFYSLLIFSIFAFEFGQGQRVSRQLEFAKLQRSKIAVARVWSTNGKINGTVIFQQESQAAPTKISANISGLSGVHAVSIHNWGDLTDKCNRMGNVFNPDRFPMCDFSERCAGSLDNLRDGKMEVFSDRIALSGLRSVIGRGVTISEGAFTESQRTDSSDITRTELDARRTNTQISSDHIACGIIALVEKEA